MESKASALAWTPKFQFWLHRSLDMESKASALAAPFLGLLVKMVFLAQPFCFEKKYR
jgi:hypothetical protein